jgi:hypothetical protein
MFLNSKNIYPDRLVIEQGYIYCENKLVVNVWDPITCFNRSMQWVCVLVV